MTKNKNNNSSSSISTSYVNKAEAAPSKEVVAPTAHTTAPKQKPWLLITALTVALVATFAISASRDAILSFASGSWFGGIVVFLAVSSVVAMIYVLAVYEESRIGGAIGIYNHADYDKQDKVNSAIDAYTNNFSQTSRSGDGSHASLIATRQANYMNMINNFYDLVTDFYEYGWGDCFHFGFRFAGEDFQESLRRTEYYLALRLGLNSSTHAVDIGCGVGGPMRNMARFSGSKITGINNNAYQIKVGQKHNVRLALDHLCSFTQADFMHIPVPDNTFDHAYAIEATCHAPDKVACYSEAFRILKPGGCFAAYDWCVTPKFDKNNPKHVATREGIEVGNGLPVLATQEEVLIALKKSGFEIIDSFNAQKDAHAGPTHVPWYQSLAGEYTSLNGFRMTPPGRFVTHMLVTVLETMRIAPRGSVKVSKLLNDTAIDLVNGGKMEIFTPSFFFIARKPL